MRRYEGTHRDNGFDASMSVMERDRRAARWAEEEVRKAPLTLESRRVIVKALRQLITRRKPSRPKSAPSIGRTQVKTLYGPLLRTRK